MKETQELFQKFALEQGWDQHTQLWILLSFVATRPFLEATDGFEEFLRDLIDSEGNSLKAVKTTENEEGDWRREVYERNTKLGLDDWVRLERDAKVEEKHPSYSCPDCATGDDDGEEVKS